MLGWLYRLLGTRRRRAVGRDADWDEDAYLSSLPPLLSEWDSPEDEEAFRDL